MIKRKGSNKPIKGPAFFHVSASSKEVYINLNSVSKIEQVIDASGKPLDEMRIYLTQKEIGTYTMTMKQFEEIKPYLDVKLSWA